jgi:peroxiredoxin
MTKKRFFKELFLTIFTLFIVSLAVNYIRSPKTYKTIPDLKLLSIDGKEINLRDNNGKPTVIHFWATWCPVCKMEATNFNSLMGEDINLITVAVKSKDLVRFIERKDLSYTIIDDIDGEVAEKFNIEVFPTTLIYNANGELEFSEVGYTTTIGLKARLGMI